MRVYPGASPVVGRSLEIEQLRRAVAEAAGGQVRAVLVHGEPGIGKTRLVSELCARERAAGTPVLWGQCVRFGATDVPYLPLVSAFEDWRATLGEERRPPPEVDQLLAAMAGEEDRSRAMRVVWLFDAALAGTSRDGLPLLVVDDLQWADQSTLDVLAYTLATARSHPLVMLVTYRDTELGEGHPLHGWLGDARSLPDVRDLPLGRLNRSQTEEQAGQLLGRTARMSLVDQVLARSDGNPYLSELLLRSVPKDRDDLPDGVPDGLRGALLAAWHRTSAGSRAVTRLLATAQKPLAEDELARVAAVAGTGSGAGHGPGLRAAVQEAIDAGVVVRDRSGLLWFHHPLLAEVLYETLSAPERTRLHSAFVTSLEDTAADDPRGAAHLALHSERAGLVDRAFTYALRAADHAAAMNAFPEEAEQLRRAAELWPVVSPDIRAVARSHARLWCDTAEVAARVGWDNVAADAIGSARLVIDPEIDPVTAARVLRTWGGFQRMAGRLSGRPVETMKEAVGISAGCGDLEEHTGCLTALAEWEWWNGDVETARLHADEGFEIAQASGSPRALTWALVARSLVNLPSQQSVEDADEAERLALELDDVDLIVDGALARANALEGVHRFGDRADAYERGYAAASEHGFGRQQQLLATLAAGTLMDVGRYDDARQMLTEALAVPSTWFGGLSARLNCTYLELILGNLEEADRQLGRALELAPDLARVHGMGPTILAVHHMVTGSPEGAVRVLDDNFRNDMSGDQASVDWTVLIAALGVGELFAGGRPPRDERAAARTVDAFRRLLAQRAARGGDPFPPTDPIAKAHRTLLHAEIARACCQDDQRPRWWDLEYVSDWVGENWVMNLGILHWAEAVAAAGASRAEIAIPLRRAHSRARESGFKLIRERAETLARRTRVSLEGTTADEPTDGLAVLTAREREVLALLSAGRSYADIARELFISPKTVSVHVSHVLQKTGTASRAEAAAWAWQNGLSASGSDR